MQRQAEDARGELLWMRPQPALGRGPLLSFMDDGLLTDRPFLSSMLEISRVSA